MRSLLITALLAVGTAPSAQQYETAARRYFETWNAHDVTGMRPLFAATATLKDWDLEKSGADEIVKANSAIFAAEPKIRIDVVTIHLSETTRTAVCEILVRLNNEKMKAMNVVKVLTFDEAGKIAAVRAYKGATSMMGKDVLSY